MKEESKGKKWFKSDGWQKAGLVAQFLVVALVLIGGPQLLVATGKNPADYLFLFAGFYIMGAWSLWQALVNYWGDY